MLTNVRRDELMNCAIFHKTREHQKDAMGSSKYFFLIGSEEHAESIVLVRLECTSDCGRGARSAGGFSSGMACHYRVNDSTSSKIL